MTVSLDHLWAGWRAEYISTATDVGRDDDACVFCGIIASDLPDEDRLVVWEGERCIALLNAFPYTSGHLMVLPHRHVGELEDLDGDEAGELWAAVTAGVRALKAAYSPGGINLGVNLGKAAGAGIPGHFHVHCLPRWAGDTNFMTSVAGARVLPEALPTTWRKVSDAWRAAEG